MPIFEEVPATRVQDTLENVTEKIAIDTEIELVINELFSRKFSISPGSLEDFAIGYLLGEGLITATKDINKIKIEESKIEVKVNLEDFDLRQELVVGSDCFGGWRHKIEFIGEVESDFKVAKRDLLESFNLLKEKAQVWKQTGGTHIAGLVNLDKFIFREDVSRHVAVDKVIGAAARDDVDFSNSYIVYSGRMPADMMIKIVRVKIPIIASNTAPTSSGYVVAQETGVTMVGFVRGNHFNVYSSPERILI